jgi:hypothetical protein
MGETKDRSERRWTVGMVAAGQAGEPAMGTLGRPASVRTAKPAEGQGGAAGVARPAHGGMLPVVGRAAVRPGPDPASVLANGTSPAVEVVTAANRAVEAAAGPSPAVEVVAAVSRAVEAAAGPSPAVEVVAGTSQTVEVVAGTSQTVAPAGQLAKARPAGFTTRRAPAPGERLQPVDDPVARPQPGRLTGLETTADPARVAARPSAAAEMAAVVVAQGVGRRPDGLAVARARVRRR